LEGGSYKVGDGPGYLIFFLSETQDLKVIAYREGPTGTVEKRSVLRHFKGAISSAGRRRQGINDLLGILIKGQAGPRERCVNRMEQILLAEADFSAERLIDELLADLKATRALLWKQKSFPGVVARIATSLGGVPTKGEITECLAITQDHCSKLCKQYGFHWLPWEPANRNSRKPRG
jgi:hypothetical protein